MNFNHGLKLLGGATTAPFEIPQRLLAVPITPETIRLPRAGERCPYSGLSRSALNALVLPTAANGYRPPVRSSVLRQRGATTGIRLIFYQSLIDYIHSHEDIGQGEEPATGRTDANGPHSDREGSQAVVEHGVPTREVTR